MKIIKRNGSEAIFDIMKIITAVTKANNVVKEDERLTPMQIRRIAESVENSCLGMNRALSVEEIQDLVEHQIMAHGALRGRQAATSPTATPASLVRKSNTTDDKILSPDRVATTRRSSRKTPTKTRPSTPSSATIWRARFPKILTARMLLPQEIVDAHEAGIIHFHDADYFAQHMHNCDLVNLEDMLQNGTVISGTLIEKPHSFSTACNIATQIIAQVASNQYGGQSISLTHLAPFVDISRQKIRKTGPRRDPHARRGAVRGGDLQGRRGPSARRDPPRRPDHPVSGRHAHDHQRPGPVHHGLHVPRRGPERAGKARPRHHHRRDAQAALSRA